MDTEHAHVMNAVAALDDRHALNAELARIERLLCFEDDAGRRKELRRRYLELTDRREA